MTYNPPKDPAAAANSAQAVVDQSASKKRYVSQRDLVAAVTRSPGLTATQLAWQYAGGSIDADGHCQPRALFAQCMKFFNAKRRASEISSGKSPKVKTGAPKKNPTDYADGVGLYPIDYSNSQIQQTTNQIQHPAPESQDESGNDEKPVGMPKNFIKDLDIE